MKEAKPEKVINLHKRREEKKNPMDKEIMELRKQGVEVPKELLEKKFAHNRERHSKDLRRQHEFLTNNYDASQVLLRDI